MFKVYLLLLFTPVSITPLIAHRVNSNRLLTFRCLHYTIEGVKFLLRKWRKIN